MEGNIVDKLHVPRKKVSDGIAAPKSIAEIPS